MNRYLIDSNFWIDARRFYPIDIFPSFWDNMQNLIEGNIAIIHQSVFEEITRKEDFITTWLRSFKGYEVMPISDSAFEKFLEFCTWAKDAKQGFTNFAIDQFEQSNRADAWLCSEAATSNLIIVTAETPSNSLNKIKIPNVCKAFNINYVDNFDFMRTHNFVF